jgi:hypothetical protein
MSDQPGGSTYYARPDPSPPSLSPLRSPRFRATAITGVAAGVIYGLLFRGLFGNDAMDDVFGVVSMGFLFLVPLALGFLTVFIGELGGEWPWSARLLLPCLASLLALFAALLFAWEGVICIALWLPLFVFQAILGALLAVIVGWALRRRRRVRWARRCRSRSCRSSSEPSSIASSRRTRSAASKRRSTSRPRPRRYGRRSPASAASSRASCRAP